MENMIGSSLAIIASLLYGVTVYIITNILFTLTSSEPLPDQMYTFEKERRIKLRSLSKTYANAEYLVVLLTKILKKSSKLKSIEENLRIVKNGVYWKPEEFLAVTIANALLTLLGLFCFFFILSFTATDSNGVIYVTWGVLFGITAAFLIYLFSLKSLKDEATHKKQEIRYQLPYIVDLMILGHGSGASFIECVTMIVEESQNPIVHDEFFSIADHLSKGRSIKGVLEEFANRYQDQDLTDLINVINKSLNLGVPLIKSLLEYGDQIRLRRQQWTKKIISEGETKIIFPTIIMLIGGIILILAPILTKYLLENGNILSV